jgi:hypothetical protein
MLANISYGNSSDLYVNMVQVANMYFDTSV